MICVLLSHGFGKPECCPAVSAYLRTDCWGSDVPAQPADSQLLMCLKGEEGTDEDQEDYLQFHAFKCHFGGSDDLAGLCQEAWGVDWNFEISHGRQE